jgi:hypothetical protein
MRQPPLLRTSFHCWDATWKPSSQQYSVSSPRTLFSRLLHCSYMSFYLNTTCFLLSSAIPTASLPGSRTPIATRAIAGLLHSFHPLFHTFFQHNHSFTNNLPPFFFFTALFNLVTIHIGTLYCVRLSRKSVVAILLQKFKAALTFPAAWFQRGTV